MSNNESFIDEVTEEVRRDKLYAALRKYGWIGILGVVLLVGGAAVNEWLKARERAAAEALGDAVLAAIETGEPEAKLAALDAIAAEGDRAALLGLVAASELPLDPAKAAEKLAAVADDPAQPPLYRDLATLKRAMLPEILGPQERVDALTPLTAPGAPFRVLAEEQIALAEIELDAVDSAIARLEALLNDNEASGALRQRAQQLIVALGGPAAAEATDGATADEATAESGDAAPVTDGTTDADPAEGGTAAGN